MTYTVTTTILSILIIESAAFSCFFGDNSKRITAFSLFVLSSFLLLAHLGLEFFGLILVLAYIPIIFAFFMMGNVVRNKNEPLERDFLKYILGVVSALTGLSLGIFLPSSPLSNDTFALFLDFASALYDKYLSMTLITSFLLFSSVISVATILSGKRLSKDEKE